MADIQTERAYQKQPAIFQNKKKVLLGETGKEKLPRYYKNISLGFNPPSSDYLHYICKYSRFKKGHKNMSVHLSPCFRDFQIDDIVTVGECWPLSKTVHYYVLKVTKAAGTKK
ncbi:40S ribosomal protein S11 [Tupaia chinensis]|uniref:40S ribosomal protein S11 n=1 Tax=Tupaia chinensis TaxID=246437 RepID=L9KKN7_TUPCH|nr:40S ribosomal protein S11 [Tupaia chinensis]